MSIKNFDKEKKSLKKWIPLFVLFCFNLTQSQESSKLIILQKENFEVKGHIQSGINAVGETNLFWNLVDVPDNNYNSDKLWLESYIKPGLSFIKTNSKSKFYGNLSFVGSSTLGTDAFNEKNQGAFTLELANLGYNLQISNNSKLDFIIGSQELKLGSGMLIANGGVSGFERGTLKFGPRKAWEMSALGKFTYKNFNFSTFYLNPNELSSNETNTKIIGFDVNLFKSHNNFSGISFLKITNSESPYPKAAPNGNGAPEIIIGARDNLNAISYYGKYHPIKKLKNLFTSFDFSYQWNKNIDLNAWGGRTQIGYDFIKLNWKPMFMFNYQVFSGDDPNTSKLERFDPLYYEGTPSSWTTGSKSSMVFINSNIKSYGLTLKLNPSPKDIITLRYAGIYAQQLKSPIQFGQASRLENNDGTTTVVAGVTKRKLADDYFIEYNRIINPNIYLNAGLALSIAGEGITNIVDNTTTWSGGYVNLVFNY